MLKLIFDSCKMYLFEKSTIWAWEFSLALHLHFSYRWWHGYASGLKNLM